MNTNPPPDTVNLSASESAPARSGAQILKDTNTADFITPGESGKSASPSVGHNNAPTMEYSDDGLAYEFTTLCSRRLKYTAEQCDKWFHWTGHCWERDKVFKTWNKVRKFCRAKTEFIMSQMSGKEDESKKSS